MTPTGSKTMNAKTITSQPASPIFNYFIAAMIPRTYPKYFHQALKHSHWIEAMDAKLHALEAKKTWELTVLSSNRKAIGCKWIFKTKFKADGSIDKYKARLVILGNKQTYGINYVEMFTPASKMATVKQCW